MKALNSNFWAKARSMKSKLHSLRASVAATEPLAAPTLKPRRGDILVAPSDRQRREGGAKRKSEIAPQEH